MRDHTGMTIVAFLAEDDRQQSTPKGILISFLTHPPTLFSEEGFRSFTSLVIVCMPVRVCT